MYTISPILCSLLPLPCLCYLRASLRALSGVFAGGQCEESITSRNPKLGIYRVKLVMFSAVLQWGCDHQQFLKIRRNRCNMIIFLIFQTVIQKYEYDPFWLFPVRVNAFGVLAYSLTVDSSVRCRCFDWMKRLLAWQEILFSIAYWFPLGVFSFMSISPNWHIWLCLKYKRYLSNAVTSIFIWANSVKHWHICVMHSEH